VSSVSSVVNPPSPAPQSATPRHIAPQYRPPAQNEPTALPFVSSCLRGAPSPHTALPHPPCPATIPEP
jgi:hypothetical protein